MEDDDSFRFTRCRRDGNCMCKICISTIISTLDLMSIRRSLINLPSSPPETPIFFNSSTISTPQSNNSTLTTDFRLKINSNKNAEFVFGLILLKCIMILCLILMLGFSFVTCKFMETKLSSEIVTNLTEKSLGFQDVKEQLGFLSNELRILVGDSVPTTPNWKIIQDGLILRFHCQLYKSGVEQVSIWGSPLQTSGLLSTEFDSRSFTILSGRVTQWFSDGEMSCLIRKTNTSWEQGKWSTSVLRLDENTWILEYKRSFMFENTRPFCSAMEFLKFKIMTTFQCVKKQLWKSCDGNHLAPT